MPSENVIINTFLTGWKEFVAGAQAQAESLTEIGAAAGFAGREADASFIKFTKMQSTFTLRRLLYGTTLATIALGAEALRLGFNYRSAMQQASVALAPVLSGTGQLRSELQYLFRFSAFTPFQFKDITVAFRQMYAAFHPLGISIGTTNTTIHSLVDALSYVGRATPAGLNRVAVALQHMAYMGRLTGQVVLQLARDGLPIYSALHKEFGLTAEQLHNIGSMGITSAQALAALNKYIESTRGFAGAAMRQATMTLHGAFTTFKDLLSQALAGSEGGFFGGFQHFFQRVDRSLAPFYNTRKPITLTAFVDAINNVLSPRTGIVINTFNVLKGAIDGVLGVFHALAWVINILLSPLNLLHGGTSRLGIAFRVLGYALGVYIGLLLVWKGTLISVEIILWAVRGVQLALAAAIWLTNFSLSATIDRLLATELAYAVFSIGVDAATLAQTLFAAATTGAATAMTALTLAILANPVTWLIAAVVLLVGGLVILYFKWKAFHDIVNNTFDYIRHHAWQVAAALELAFAPIGVAVEGLLAVIRYWGRIKSFFGNIFGGSGGHATVPQFGHLTTYSGVKLNTMGGQFYHPYYPGSRTRVLHPTTGNSPASFDQQMPGLNGLLRIEIRPQDINLDGRKLATVHAEVVTNKEARL